jgi:hypothetical protein
MCEINEGGQKFEFRSTVDYLDQPKSEVIVITDAVTLDEIVLKFEEFLRGSGFVFDGRLDFVNDESYDLTELHSDECSCCGDCGDHCPDLHEEEGL